VIKMGDVEPPPVPEELDEHELNRLIGEGQIPNILHTPCAFLNSNIGN
jgi:hypothetical protein